MNDNFLNYYINKIFNSYTKGEILNELSEKRNFRGIELSGNSFQVAQTHNLLKEANTYLQNDKLNLVIDFLRITTIENYNKFGFNYFQQKGLPDDLDTASAITTALEDKSLTEEYIKRLKNNMNTDGSIPTWFVNDSNFDRERFFSVFFYKENRLIQSDVMINAFYCLKKRNNNLLNNEQILAMLNKYGIGNFWYLPDNYSKYFIVKFVNKYFNPEQKNKFINKQIIPNLIESHKTQVNTINPMMDNINKKNKNNNWLDHLFSLGYYCELSILLNNKTLEESVNNYFKNISENIDKDSHLYWTIGLETFQSKIMSYSYLLNIYLNTNIQKIRKV